MKEFVPLIDITQADFLAGEVVLIDKPKGWTSFDVVNKLRYQLKKMLDIKKIKVGHAGTLDPLATGLLIVCTGKMTKRIDQIQALTKAYSGSFVLGATTPSYDKETEPDQVYPIDHITPLDIENARLKHIGQIEQKPPIFSAIKVDGQPLYKKARKGIQVDVPFRTITIFDFEVNAQNLPLVDFKVICSKGTYIRSLAFTFGKELQSGAHLGSLQRDAIGNFHLKNAWDLDNLVQEIENYKEEKI